MRIAVLNVKFSPNLGDGLIADCLEGALLEHPLVDEVFSVDLAGREDYGATATSRLRPLLLPVLNGLPAYPRRAAVQYLLGRQIVAARTAWARALTKADAVMIGGGQLLADADLNFPRKLDAATALVPESVPLAVFGVGVSGGWSPRGAALFERLLRKESLVSVHVRDGQSRDRLADAVPGLPKIAVTPDPGILASATYPSVNRARARDGAGAERRIGLGVIAPAVQKLHADSAATAATARFFADLAMALSALGRPVLFTNGAAEDETHLSKVMATLSGMGKGDIAERAARPDTPEALCSLIASFDGLVAHRLHANVAAASLGVPSVGLVWESKVAAFYGQLGFPARAMAGGEQRAETIRARLDAAMREGPAEKPVQAAMAEVREDLGAVIERLSTYARSGSDRRGL